MPGQILASTSSPAPADWPHRLNDPAPAVRRVAILDAARSNTPHVPAMLIERLPSERDPKARLLIIRALGTLASAPSMPTLAQLRDNPNATPHERHAALLAHDAIEVALRPPPFQPVEDPEPATETDET